MTKGRVLSPLLAAGAVLGFITLILVITINPFKFHDHLVEPPLPVNDFTLQTAGGESFRLSDQKGKIVLLFFGYTYCPNACPTTLSTYRQVYEELGENADHFRFVMITTDPVRDTPDMVARYVGQFNSEFIGLGGSLADLEPIWREFGVVAETQDSDGEEEDQIGHTASVYVIDRDGDFVQTIPYNANIADVTRELLRLLDSDR